MKKRKPRVESPFGGEATHRNAAQREADLETTSELYRQGLTQVAIAGRLGISQQQVSLDIKELQLRWRVSGVFNVNEARNRELDKIDYIERVAWEGWFRSVGEMTRERKGTNAKGEPYGWTETWTEAGADCYLGRVCWCIERRCKLFGLDAAPGRHDAPPEREYMPKEKLLARIRERLAALGCPMPDENGPPRLVSN